MTDELHPSTVQVLDHALRDSDTPGQTRRWLLERAAAGAAGVAAGSALAPGAAFAHGVHGSGHGGGAGINEFGTVAVTTEALTVTLLSELLRRVNLAGTSTGPAAVKALFEGAYAAELDHFRFTRAHWHPTTTTFWIPDGFFGGSGNTVDLTSVGMALVAGETLFVNRGHDVRAGRTADVRTLLSRARRVRVRASRAGRDPPERQPAEQRRFRGLLDPPAGRDRIRAGGRRSGVRHAGIGAGRLLPAGTSADGAAAADQRQHAKLVSADRRVATGYPAPAYSS